MGELNGNGAFQFVIEAQDWKEEYAASPVKPTDEESIIELMQESNMKPMQAARLALVARELGDADADILPPNKVTLNLGAANTISQKIARRVKPVQINGHDYSVRQYVATVRDEQAQDEREYDLSFPAIDTKNTLVETGDPEALERALKYLQDVVPGHIWKRFLVLIASGGDVKVAAKALKKSIDEMVARLV